MPPVPIIYLITFYFIKLVSGAGFEPGHRSLRRSSLYDENALAHSCTGLWILVIKQHKINAKIDMY